MSVNVKEKFALLKYEQLLSDKYFVETCFSKKYESKTSKESLKNYRSQIGLLHSKEFPTSFSLGINCEE